MPSRGVPWIPVVGLLILLGVLLFGSVTRRKETSADGIPRAGEEERLPSEPSAPDVADSASTVTDVTWTPEGSPEQPAPTPTTPASRSTSEIQTFGPYRVKLERRRSDYWMDHVQVLHKGWVVYEMDEQDGGFFIGHMDHDNSEVKPELIAMGRDITGDGMPNLVIAEYSGGAHCCLSFHIFELGDTLRHVATLDGGHGDLSRFDDLDGDGVLEFLTWDWTWDGFGQLASFADSPFPRVIFRYSGGSYVLAEDLMQHKAPDPDALQALLAKVGDADLWEMGLPPAALWQTMVDLVYSGNGHVAWRIFDETWRGYEKTRRSDSTYFEKTLRSSPYWTALDRLNGEGHSAAAEASSPGR